LDYVGDTDLFFTRKQLCAPAPVQLAPKHCDCFNCNWNGKNKLCEQKYLTVTDMQNYFAEQVRIQRKNAETETTEAMSKMQTSFIEMMKKSDENTKNLLSQHYEFMRRLPKESSAVRARKEIEKNKIFMKKMKAQQKLALKIALNLKKTTPATQILCKSFGKKNIEVSEILEEEVETPHSVELEVTGVIETPIDVKVSEVFQEVEASIEVKVLEVFQEVKTTTEFDVKLPDVLSLPENWQEVKKKTIQKQNKTNLTQMCNSVFTGEECLYKEKCRFAHSKSELLVFDCPFGSNCHYVKNKSNGVYTSVEGKFCKNKHPGETKDNFCSRTFKKKIFSENKIVSNTLLVCQDKPVLKKIESKNNSSEEVVLLVPEEMALQALEIMINSGKMNITIKLI
jgi:hypothetical protein